MAKVTITHDTDDEVYKVAAPYDDDWREAAKDKGAKWDPQNRTWDFADGAYTLDEVEREVRIFFPNADIEEG